MGGLSQTRKNVDMGVMNQSSSSVNGEGEEEKKMVDITLKTIGPSPPFRLRVPASITVILNPFSLLSFFFSCSSCAWNFILLLVHLCGIKIQISIQLHNMKRVLKNYVGMGFCSEFGKPLYLGFSPGKRGIVGRTRIKSILFDGSLTNACIKFFMGFSWSRGKLSVQAKLNRFSSMGSWQMPV